MNRFPWLRFGAAIVFVCLAAVLPAAAQTTTITASYIGGAVRPAASATLYVQPVTGCGTAFQGARMGSNQGQIQGVPYVGTVRSGVVSVAVPDALQSSPNIAYAVTAIDNTTGGIIFGMGLQADGVHVQPGGAYGCLQPTGASWSLDTFVPGAQPTVLPASLFSAPSVTTLVAGSTPTAAVQQAGSGQYQLQFGLPGSPTFAGGSAAPLAAGSAPTMSLTGGPAAYTLNLGLPQSPSVSTGTATQLAYGASPTVSNSGSAYAPVFNFGIPAGQPIPVSAQKGAWATGTSYSIGDLVAYNGASYLSLVNSNIGNQPDTSPADWSQLTSLTNLPQALATQSAANPQPGTFTTVAAGTISLSLPGADPTGATDNSTIVNTAIANQVSNGYAAGTCLSLPAGKYYVPSLSNTYGVCLVGPGVLLKSVSQTETGAAPYTTKAQANSYAYAAPRLYFGQEYLSHWMQMAEANSASIAANINVTCSGDSTTYGTNTSGGFDPCGLFGTIASGAGIQGVVTTNAGHAGKDSADWVNTYLATDLATNPDVYFVRWGINDALYGITPSQTIANIRSGLATIRASKSVDQMTIILEMPSSTNNNVTGAAPSFYEQLRNGFAQAARDYQAAFIDNYGALPDNDFAVQTCMMDLPYANSGTPPIHIHPGNCKAPFYADLVAKLMVSPLRNIYGAAGCVNLSDVTYQPDFATALPSTYPYGCSIYRANTGAWPLNGQVITFRGKDGQDTIQFNNAYNAASSSVCIRTSQNASTWNAMTCLGGGVQSGAVSEANPTTTGMQIGVSGGNPNIVWTNVSAPLDTKMSDIFANSSGLVGRLLSDNGATTYNWFTLTRNGATPYSLAFNEPTSAPAINPNPTATTITGTSGTASCSQGLQGTQKIATCYLNGYAQTGTAQTFNFGAAYSATPVLLEGGGSCGGYNPTATATALTLPASAAMTAETCNVVVLGQ